MKKFFRETNNFLFKNQRVFVETSTFRKPYVQHLRKFFLKVHPDFFQDNKKHQEVNQNSFKTLNELLNWIKIIEEKKQIPQIESKQNIQENLKFYCKFSDKTVKLIESKIEIKKNVFDSNNINQIVESIDECILRLLFKSNIISEKDNFNISKKKKDLREELRLALANNLQNENLEKIKFGWWDDEIPTLDQLIESKMVFISDELNVEQMGDAMENLENNLKEMEFYKWRNIPLMIGPNENEYSISNSKFKKEFNLKNFLLFLTISKFQLF
jgi:hypothetical protein